MYIIIIKISMQKLLLSENKYSDSVYIIALIKRNKIYNDAYINIRV